MQDSQYQETLDWLFQQFPAYQKVGASAYKPSLDNCLKLASFFGNPQDNLTFIHIAGTNGKGSTSSMLASILTETGMEVGLFTSPHIEDFRERIRVNGEMISEEEVIAFCDKIKKLNLDFEPSFFELTWVMALVHFCNKTTNVCVVETGLGGRLDATNIINPILSIITNIGLEHTLFLGNTLEQIAFEKAGIIKKSIPIILGESLPETLSVFQKKANECHATLLLAEKKKVKISAFFPLLGDYQVKNYKSVETAIDYLNTIGFQITELSIEKGLKNLALNTGFRGRLQVMNQEPLTIMDVSHNYDGIKATLESILKINKGTLRIIYGTSSDKDIESIFSLFPKEADYYFTEFTNERSAKLIQLMEKSKDFKLKSTFFLNPKEALKIAQTTVKKEDTILIFGSFFLLSDFF
ncbi:MAG: bifunctional folylpolyglutamate synthase/dihydrofolate synthase [Flavobacteriia bacterium]|nr:bifunctional folylpolyglutamate synthase/dihydrofolate synthase [Flavobacteriia bacterium]